MMVALITQLYLSLMLKYFDDYKCIYYSTIMLVDFSDCVFVKLVNEQTMLSTYMTE